MPVFRPLTFDGQLLAIGQVICTVPGAYSFLGTKATTSATNGNGITRAASIFVPEPVILDRIGVEVTAAGEAGCTVRLGIWADAGNSTLPGTLVLDAGTVTGDSIAIKELTISQLLQPGIYWLSGTVQGAPTSQPTTRQSSTGFEPVGGHYNSAATPALSGMGVARTDAAGLASTWGTSVSPAGNAPRVFVRTV